ncbi:MAG: alkylmercury lyase family protein, partial [Chloroflexota bacterium]|nr:alkylmercury lyase family protein [Chloroflexota bacterium]
ANVLHLSEDDVLHALRSLDEMHSVFLTGDGRGVLMANPFSAVPTPFRVSADGVDYWANCAWDMLGVPAALGRDATIHATYAADDTTTEIQVVNGDVEGAPGIVHFQQPFRAWYDDLSHT